MTSAEFLGMIIPPTSRKTTRGRLITYQAQGSELKDAIMLHVTVSAIEDPELFGVLTTLSGRNRAGKARALMRRGLSGQVSFADAPNRTQCNAPSPQPAVDVVSNAQAVQDFDSLGFDFDIDDLLSNLKAGVQPN